MYQTSLAQLDEPLFCRVTEIEAQRLEDTKDDREAFRKLMREEIDKQAREKHLDLKLDR